MDTGHDSLLLAANEIRKELDGLVRRQRKLESALKPLLALIEESSDNGASPTLVQGTPKPRESRIETPSSLSRRLAKRDTTIVEGAEIVLRQAGEPLKTAEIARRLLSGGFKYDKEFKTLRASVMGSLDHRVKSDDTFCKIGPGKYALIEWGLAAGDDPELEFDAGNGRED